ncbi:autotransporter outer membrane beta-barrel domain-containing protein [Pseudomonas kribbensis]|uniref:Autotransporter outer membrane beta-barrel domain-containing protein n=1 Tax=Pseudomonas kribbensis TaxID=1628086 RepID=A0A345RYB7_9PSED|nr:autotransporter outer membrane beta-barrel domain-containing protein [Pseudomonas kribbensis]
MPIQCKYKLQHLVLAVALAVGCVEFSLAEQSELDAPVMDEVKPKPPRKKKEKPAPPSLAPEPLLEESIAPTPEPFPVSTETPAAPLPAPDDIPTEKVATTESGSALEESIERPAPLPEPVLTETSAAQQTQVIDQPPSTNASPSAGNAAIEAVLAADETTAALAYDQLAGGSNANLAKATLSSVTPVSASLLSAMHQLDNIHDTQRDTPRHASGNADTGRVWLQAIGHGGKLDRDVEPMQHSTKGLLLGTDWRVTEEWRVGLMGGTSDTRMDSKELDGDLDSWHVGAYALRQTGPLSLRLGAAWSNHEGSTRREVAFGRFHDRLKGNYHASTRQVFIESGYNLGRASVSIEPFAGIGYERYQRDGYTEKGGDAALKVHAQSQGNFNTTVGLRMAKVSTLDNGMRLTPRFSAGWKHIYGETYTSTRQRLAKGGHDYTVYGAELDRNSLKLDTGLDLAISNSHTLGVGLAGEIGSDSRNHGVSGQWRMAF